MSTAETESLIDAAVNAPAPEATSEIVGPGLALGTVQLGLPYGAANKHGMPSAEDATAILRHAVDSGVKTLDTAHGYQLSQERVGTALKEIAAAGLPLPAVVTKLDTAIGEAGSADEVVSIVDASVSNSAEKLGTTPLDCVCLHMWESGKPHGGAAWSRLKHHKAKGTVRRIGTSTYNPSEVCEGGSPRQVPGLRRAPPTLTAGRALLICYGRCSRRWPTPSATTSNSHSTCWTTDGARPALPRPSPSGARALETSARARATRPRGQQPRAVLALTLPPARATTRSKLSPY